MQKFHFRLIFCKKCSFVNKIQTYFSQNRKLGNFSPMLLRKRRCTSRKRPTAPPAPLPRPRCAYSPAAHRAPRSPPARRASPTPHTHRPCRTPHARIAAHPAMLARSPAVSPAPPHLLAFAPSAPTAPPAPAPIVRAAVSPPRL